MLIVVQINKAGTRSSRRCRDTINKEVMNMQLSDTSAPQSDSHNALRLMVSAWEEGTDAGISPELMAYAALYTGLSDLVGAIGENQVAVLLEGFAVRIRGGEFTFQTTWQ